MCQQSFKPNVSAIFNVCVNSSAEKSGPLVELLDEEEDDVTFLDFFFSFFFPIDFRAFFSADLSFLAPVLFLEDFAIDPNVSTAYRS